MKSIKRIFFLLSFISVSYLSTLAQENQSYFLHTIEKGQSLYSISSMYGVSKADIIRLNPGCEDKIYAGQAIKIPQNKTAQKSEMFHTIQPGETLYRLTTTYKVSAKAICDANPGLSAENFRIGQVIRIPSAAEAIDSTVEAVVTTPEQPIIQPAVKPRCRDMHKVKRRETIFSVSRAYGISAVRSQSGVEERYEEGTIPLYPLSVREIGSHYSPDRHQYHTAKQQRIVP